MGIFKIVNVIIISFVEVLEFGVIGNKVKCKWKKRD